MSYITRRALSTLIPPKVRLPEDYLSHRVRDILLTVT